MTKKNSPKLPVPKSVRKLFPQVTHVVEATDPVEVSVNKKDCTGARKLDPAECALARATRRELHAQGAIIGISTSYIIKNDMAVRFQTPESVRREIVSFDRHDDFAPGDYYLTPKSPSASLEAQRVRNRSNEFDYHKSSKRAKRKHHTSVRVRTLPKGY